MRGLRFEHVIAWVSLIALFAVFAVTASWDAAALGEPSRITGYVLYALILVLALFNVRKKLSMIPLLKASTWLMMHSMGGVFAIGLYWLHAPNLWPAGLQERVLTALFYLVTVTGVFGYLIQRVYPARLTQTGIEVIYERIPAELARIRAEAEAIVVECSTKTGSDTLARHYFESFAWFFRRPRFMLGTLFGGQRGLQWVRQEWQTIGRYLNAEETRYLDRLAELGYEKTRLDIHHTLQSR